MVPHTLEGREGICLACHETGAGGAPKVPDDHAGRTNELCLICHQPGEVEAEVEGDAARGAEVFVAYGCNGCHNVEAEVILVGPSLFDIGVRADEDYIEESIVDPSAEVVEGFADGLMPKDYGSRISEDELEDLIAYLLSLTGQ